MWPRHRLKLAKTRSLSILVEISLAPAESRAVQLMPFNEVAVKVFMTRTKSARFAAVDGVQRLSKCGGSQPTTRYHVENGFRTSFPSVLVYDALGAFLIGPLADIVLHNVILSTHKIVKIEEYGHYCRYLSCVLLTRNQTGSLGLVVEQA